MGVLDELPLLTRHRITVTDYHRMAEVGLLAHDARVELIEGEVVDMAPTGLRHASVANPLARDSQVSFRYVINSCLSNTYKGGCQF